MFLTDTSVSFFYRIHQTIFLNNTSIRLSFCRVITEVVNFLSRLSNWLMIICYWLQVANPSHKWASLLNIVCSFHLVVIIVSAATGVVGKEIPGLLNWGIQLAGVYSLLLVVDGLTRDEGRSVLSRICTLRITQQLGTLDRKDRYLTPFNFRPL